MTRFVMLLLHAILLLSGMAMTISLPLVMWWVFEYFDVLSPDWVAGMAAALAVVWWGGAGAMLVTWGGVGLFLTLERKP